MRTYDRAAFLKAKEAWESGNFGWQWSTIRQTAAHRGYLFPPTGTVHDDRDAESPSQRSIIWRALEDNPRELVRIVSRCSSWSEVVDRIIGLEDRLRAEAGLAARNREWDAESAPTERDDAMSLARILERITDSTGRAA